MRTRTTRVKLSVLGWGLLRLGIAAALALMLFDSVLSHRCPCHDPIETPEKEYKA